MGAFLAVIVGVSIRRSGSIRSLRICPPAAARNMVQGAGSDTSHRVATQRIRTTEEAIVADEQRDVIEVLEHDHREVEQMFVELESLRGAATDGAKARRKELADQVTIELVRHSVAEEVLVYPEVEKKVSAEEADHARKEHADAEETLHRLEKLDADDAAFDDELATLMREIRHHIKDEEGQMFVHMRQVIDA